MAEYFVINMLDWNLELIYYYATIQYLVLLNFFPTGWLAGGLLLRLVLVASLNVF